MTKLLFIFIISAMHPTVFTLHDSRTSLKHYCQVPSPIDPSVFNFTTMQDEHKDSIIRINDKDYLRVHFCRPLKEPCNGKQDYAVCLHANRKEIGVGKEPPKVAIEDGKIMFRYTGDKCNNTHNYTVDIEMKCSFSIKKIEVNLDILYNRDQCSFQTAVKTFAACAKRKRTTCEVYDDESDYYNLKPLMNYAGNYIVKLNPNVSVILNVCHSLIYGQHFGECNHETMVCLVDETDIEHPRYTRIGNVNDYVHFAPKNGSVFMELSSDTPCNKGDGTGLKTIRTTIQFICKLDATNKLPEYINGMGTCHYRFRWLTAAACSEDMLIQQSETNQEPCKITDPLYNELFDLSTLRDSFTVLDSDHDVGAVYEFSVCSPLQRSNCTTTGIGVCKYIEAQNVAVSKGLANSNLMWRKNHIFLNYTDGVACGNNQRSYTTIIFKCAYSTSVLVDDKDPCATIITWSTSAVCSHRCITSDYSWNLNNLREEDHNYHVAGESENTEFHVNVCEPLFDEDYTNCTYGTGICKVGINEEGMRISETNLGSQESGLKTTEDGRIYLSFVNGSICEEDSSKRISTEITFTCDAETHAVNRVFLGLGPLFNAGYTFGKFVYIMKGIPIFKSYNNCKYDLIWNTSLICPETEVVVSDGCLVDSGIRFVNQTHLLEDSHFTVHRNKTAGTFNVNHCGKLNECNGTFVCANKTWDRKGLLRQVNIDNNLVAFKFTNEFECKQDNFYDSLIDLWCTVWEGSAESFLFEEGECDTIVDWARNYTDCELKGNKNASLASSDVILITLAVAIVLATVGIIIYCQLCRAQRTVCMNNARNYMNRYIPLRRRPAEEQAAEEINMG